MTEVYEIRVQHGYLGLGYYGERVDGVFRRLIRLPSDYDHLGETVFFSKEQAEANIPYISDIVAERNHKRWDEEEKRFTHNRSLDCITATHSHCLIPHSHSL